MSDTKKEIQNILEQNLFHKNVSKINLEWQIQKLLLGDWSYPSFSVKDILSRYALRITHYALESFISFWLRAILTKSTHHERDDG